MSTSFKSVYLKPLPDSNKSAFLGDFYKQLEKDMSSNGLALASKGGLSFYPHLNDQKLAARHPGEIRTPPPPVPVEPDPDDPIYIGRGKAFDRALRTFDRALAKRTSYDQLVLFILTIIHENLPADDTLCISAVDTTDSDPFTSIRVACNYLDDKYDSLSETALENLKYIINRPLSLETSLDGNFSHMKSANATLTAKGVGFSENQLFQAACSKLSKNPRTKCLVEDYKKRDAYSSTTATFSAFSAWAVTQYDNRSAPEGTAAFAFCPDPDYLSVPSPPPPPSTPVKSPEPVAAATVSPAGQITLTAAEIEAVIEARKKSDKKTGKKSPRSGTRVAWAWCILCGHGSHGANYTSKKGNVAYCDKMSDRQGNPRPGYTSAQVTCTTPTGPPVDGMVRSQAVMPGFTKP